MQDPKNICFDSLTQELCSGLAKGHIYSLRTAWERYTELLSEFDMKPGTYYSNRFKCKLQEKLI